MSINPLSIDDLMSRKDEVVEAHNEAMNDLEQKYFSDMTQLYRIKQAMQCQLQTSLMDSLHEINTMIKQKMRGSIIHSNNTTTNNSLLSNEHRNKSKHHSSVRPKPPSFSSHHIHHHPAVLPISSLPVINPPSVSLSTSIDAILHHKLSRNSTASPLFNKWMKQKKKRKKSTVDINGTTSYPYHNALDIMCDPMPLDFNLVTVPDEILHDVQSIVANNARNKHRKKLPMKPRPPPMSINGHVHNRELSQSLEGINIKIDTKQDVKGDIKGDIKAKPDTLECSLCHQAFDTQHNLEAHMDRAHSFKCELCSKSFQKRIDLKRHQRLHEGVKVYECKICYKTYRSPGSLHNHMRLHEVSNLFTCSYCKKGFTQSHHLKRHLRIHTGVTPFRCRYCERPFKYNTSCRRHERTVHKDVYKPESPGDTINNPNALVGVNDKDGDDMDQDNEGEDEETDEED